MGWTNNPNQIRDLNMEAPEFKFSHTPWITGIYEGWVTMFKLTPHPFKVLSNFGVIITDNINGNHTTFFIHTPHQF